mmetsp:Transcript_31293/g.94668  ORF Transcript_31293/g.94668 Transcript_31293/m.94668 type:complete len:206 (+) Transcript_31293:1066-1683(+)
MLEGLEADQLLHRSRHAANERAEASAWDCKVRWVREKRRHRVDGAPVELFRILYGHRLDCWVKQLSEHALRVDGKNARLHDRLKPAGVRPLDPQRRLADPMAGAHRDALLACALARPRSRRSRGDDGLRKFLGVRQQAARQDKGRHAVGSRDEDLVLRPQMPRLYRLVADPFHARFVEADPQTEKRVLLEARPGQVEPQLLAEGP